MFKSATRSDEASEKLARENLRLLSRVDTLEAQKRQLEERVESLERNKSETLSEKLDELRTVEDELNEQAVEKERIRERKDAIEERYSCLRTFFERLRDSFRRQSRLEKPIGATEVRGMEGEFDTLLEQSRTFQQSVKVMKKISYELELLGVNATIQAAHAGEKGKGFLIVAEEINKLSQHSRRSVEEMLVQLQVFTQVAHTLTEDFGRTVERIEADSSAFEELKLLVDEQLPESMKEDRETKNRL